MDIATIAVMDANVKKNTANVHVVLFAIWENTANVHVVLFAIWEIGNFSKYFL
jgi:hypothetical protein